MLLFSLILVIKNIALYIISLITEFIDIYQLSQTRAALALP